MKKIDTADRFERPNHPDFKDASELKAEKFSGYRMNSLNNYAEIWVEGELRADISPAVLQLNPMAINEAMANIFGLDAVMPDTPEARAYTEGKK